MTNRPRVRAWLLGSCCALPLAASCAHESTPSLENAGGAASAGKGAAGNKAGGSSNVPVAGTINGAAGTSSSASGGGTGQGGASNGDTTGPDSDAGAPSNSGGKAGSGGGSGGSGGGDAVPPDVLKRASAVVYYRTSEAAASSKKVQMKLNIVNQSADPLPMSHVSIRYWLTAEVTPTLHQYYVAAQLTMPNAEFVSNGADSHALMTFGGGSITMGQDINSSEVQLDISTSTGSFDQSDDFSWDASATSASKPNPRITLYLDDELIWGCEPSGRCFDDAGAGGAGGAGSGGSVGAGGEPAQTGAGQAGQGGAP